MEHNKWLEKVTHGDNLNTIAVRSGITPSTLYRQVEAGEISLVNVVKIAHAYRLDIGASLVSTGHLEGVAGVSPGLVTVSDDALLDEVRRRMS